MQASSFSTTPEETRSRKLLLRSVCMAIGIISTQANAEENFQLNSISILATDRAKPNAVTGLGTDSGRQAQVAFEHFGVNRWGTFYFELESIHGKGVGTLHNYGYNGRAFDLYAVAIPRVSLAKITGKSFTFGPVSDVSLIARVVEDSYYRYQAVGFGVTLSFDVPGFDVFDSGLLTHNTWWDVNPVTFDSNTGRNHTLDKKQWMWRSYLVSKPIYLAGQRFNFSLQNYVNGTGDGNANRHGTNVFIRSEFLWNIGTNSDYQLGLRLDHSRYRNSASIGFGDNAYRSTVPYLMFKHTL